MIGRRRIVLLDAGRALPAERAALFRARRAVFAFDDPQGDARIMRTDAQWIASARPDLCRPGAGGKIPTDGKPGPVACAMRDHAGRVTG